jgi:hypothetical protein
MKGHFPESLLFQPDRSAADTDSEIQELTRPRDPNATSSEQSAENSDDDRHSSDDEGSEEKAQKRRQRSSSKAVTFNRAALKRFASCSLFFF